MLLKLESRSFLGNFFVLFSGPRAHGICHLSYLKSKPKLVILYGLRQLQSRNEKCGLLGSDTRALAIEGWVVRGIAHCKDLFFHHSKLFWAVTSPSNSRSLCPPLSVFSCNIYWWGISTCSTWRASLEAREEGRSSGSLCVCNLMDPLFSFPGDLPERHNSRCRILFVIESSFLQNFLAVCSHFFPIWELLCWERHCHGSAPLNMNESSHLLSFACLPDIVLSCFMSVSCALRAWSHLILTQLCVVDVCVPSRCRGRAEAWRS